MTFYPHFISILLPPESIHHQYYYFYLALYFLSTTSCVQHNVTTFYTIYVVWDLSNCLHKVSQSHSPMVWETLRFLYTRLRIIT
jgi:hypothetical protein